MNCMKCGRETVNEQVFCEECLAEMEKYPVKPGTVVQLPNRREEGPGRKPNRRRKEIPSPEEQVKSLRKMVRILLAALAVTLALLAAAGYYAVEHLLETDVKFLPGQNYTSITSTESGTPE